MKTYRFSHYWLTTDRELTAEERADLLGEFDVPPEELLAIEGGGTPDEILAVEDPYIEPELEEEVITEPE